MRYQYRRGGLPIAPNQNLEVCAMTKSWKSRFLCLTAVVGLALCATASAREMVNIVKNPGFEDGMPAPWSPTSGDYKVQRGPEEAHSGHYFAVFSSRKYSKGGYSSLNNMLKVYPGVTYDVGVWGKGRGSVDLWVVQYTQQGKFSSTDFGRGQDVDGVGKTSLLTGNWQHYQRTWTAPEGIYGAGFFLRVSAGAVASFDDAHFSYDRDTFTPPEAETLEVTTEVKVVNANFKLTLNGKPFDGPAKILYGEHVIGIEAHATGDKPRLSGSVRFGDHVVKLDKRWRSSALPADNSWRESGYDDGQWQPVLSDAGLWDADGLKNIALRRVVLWKSSRKDPWRENQWLSMVRDRMYVAEGSAGAFVHIVPEREKIRATDLILHVEAPAFLRLLDRFEKATAFHSNYAYKKVETSLLEKDGVAYTHFKFVYNVPVKAPWKAFAPMYFKAAEKIPGEKRYTFTFWREWNGNVTDVPMTMPLIVTGPVNGRQCKYFHLSYNRPVLCHSGGFGTFSMEERQAMADTCIAAGMNVAWAVLTEQNRVLDYFLDIKKRGVLLAYGANIGMNWPRQEAGDESPAGRALAAHPEVRGRYYDGSKAVFESSIGHRHHDMTGKTMWCQEYVATDGKLFYDLMRPRYEEAKKKLGDILYTMWDWEYNTMGWSCFCDRCKSAFGKFAGVANAVKLSDETIVKKYPRKWIAFRLDQSARHQLSMMKFLKEYDILLTNWHPGGGIECSDFDYSLLGDTYDYHFMGWPGSDLPTLGSGRAPDFNSAWKKLNPEVHLVAQTIVDMFPGHVIDERMFKVWTLNIALGTYGGGWFFWLDSMYPLPQSHGMSYFIGEATRLIDSYEEFFKKRKHISGKFEQQGLTGKLNELIALEGPDGKDALVLLFNQGDEPAEVTVTVKDAAAGWTNVQQWEGPAFDGAGKVTLTVPEKDVIALRYR